MGIVGRWAEQQPQGNYDVGKQDLNVYDLAVTNGHMEWVRAYAHNDAAWWKGQVATQWW